MKNSLNIQTLNIDVHAYTFRKVFDDYNVISSYPIDREKFLKELINASIPNEVFVYNIYGDLVDKNIIHN